MSHNARTTTYDPSRIAITFGPVRISGIADATFCKVSRAESKYTTKAGADGETARSRNLNRIGTVEITLLQTSAANAELAALHLADEISDGGTPGLPLMVKDLEGNSLTVAFEAWIEKTPDEEYAKEVGERTWVFGTGNLVVHPAGN